MQIYGALMNENGQVALCYENPAITFAFYNLRRRRGHSTHVKESARIGRQTWVREREEKNLAFKPKKT